MAVIDCLEDPDETLKLKTLELLVTMTKANNVQVKPEKEGCVVGRGGGKDEGGWWQCQEEGGPPPPGAARCITSFRALWKAGRGVDGGAAFRMLVRHCTLYAQHRLSVCVLKCTCTTLHCSELRAADHSNTAHRLAGECGLAGHLMWCC
jgi:hypothetical protein